MLAQIAGKQINFSAAIGVDGQPAHGIALGWGASLLMIWDACTFESPVRWSEVRPKLGGEGYSSGLRMPLFPEFA
jgi:hypothetical protein